MASPLLSSNRISAHPFVPARIRGKLLWHFLRSLCRPLCQWPCGTIGAADDPNSCSIRGSPALWAAIGIIWHCMALYTIWNTCQCQCRFVCLFIIRLPSIYILIDLSPVFTMIVPVNTLPCHSHLLDVTLNACMVFCTFLLLSTKFSILNGQESCAEFRLKGQDRALMAWDMTVKLVWQLKYHPSH